MGMAVLCANDQDKFFEYHDVLFEEAENIEKADDLKELAKDAGLDETKFNQCFDSQEYLDRAKQWYQQGNDDFERAGIVAERRGTPSFVINNEMIIGAQSYDKFIEVIERKLAE
jgi:protein-disulfide isomerase